MAATAAASSPLCTWLVAAAACMSISTCDQRPHSTNRGGCRDRRLRRRVLQSVSSKCDVGSVSGGVLSGGSRIHGLVSSCLAFEPCSEYSSSDGFSLGFFGGDGLVSSPFRSRTRAFNRRLRRRRLNRPFTFGDLFCCVMQSLLLFDTCRLEFDALLPSAGFEIDFVIFPAVSDD